MNHTGTRVLNTKRLVLRPFKLEDADDMFKNYTSHEKVTKFLTWNAHKTIDDTKKYLQEMVLPKYENLSTYRWAIVLKSTNEVIGCIDVCDINEKNFRAELGWCLGDDFWGRGIMPEAAREVIKYLFSVGFKRIQAQHKHENTKSGRVMQKVGMKFEGVLRKYHLDNTSNLVDTDLYAITDTDEIL